MKSSMIGHLFKDVDTILDRLNWMALKTVIVIMLGFEHSSIFPVFINLNKFLWKLEYYWSILAETELQIEIVPSFIEKFEVYLKTEFKYKKLGIL